MAATTAPPITSLWPFRYLVVEWITASAPHSIGRWSAGDMKVLSATTSAPARLACRQTASRSVIRSSGLLGVSTRDQLRAGSESRRHGLRVRQVDELDLEQAAPLELVEEPERAAVAVLRGDDPVARVEQLAHQSDRGHAGGGDDRAVAALGLGQCLRESGARRVAGPRVVVGPLAIQPSEGEVGRQVQRRDDRAVLRVGGERRAHRAGCRVLA